MLIPNWTEYETYLGWFISDEFKEAYEKSAQNEPPILKLTGTEYLLASISGFSNQIQDLAIAWSDEGEPVYFKRSIEHANQLYVFTGGEEEILIGDTRNSKLYNENQF